MPSIVKYILNILGTFYHRYKERQAGELQQVPSVAVYDHNLHSRYSCNLKVGMVVIGNIKRESFFLNGPIPASVSVYFRLFNTLQFKFKLKLKKA